MDAGYIAFIAVRASERPEAPKNQDLDILLFVLIRTLAADGGHGPNQGQSQRRGTWRNKNIGENVPTGLVLPFSCSRSYSAFVSRDNL